MAGQERGWGMTPGPRWAITIAALIAVLNLFDGLLTMLWVHTGVATEANPVWGDLVAQSPEVFMAMKMLVVSAGVYFLAHQRQRRIARVGLLVSFAAYAAVFNWHLSIMSVVGYG